MKIVHRSGVQEEFGATSTFTELIVKVEKTSTKWMKADLSTVCILVVEDRNSFSSFLLRTLQEWTAHSSVHQSLCKYLTCVC